MKDDRYANLLNYSNIYVHLDIVSYTLSVYNKAIKINFVTLLIFIIILNFNIIYSK